MAMSFMYLASSNMADINAVAMPKWGLDMTEGTLVKWHVAEGERVEKGQVILYLDNPAFRAWTLDTRRHFLNSILYGPGLGTNSPHP